MPKKKQKSQKTSSPTPQKRQAKTSMREIEETAQTRPSSLRVVESVAQEGVFVKDIPRYIPPSRPGVKVKKPIKKKVSDKDDGDIIRDGMRF